MGFSFRVAPGVRIRASSRGLRASVGPRAARVHFGSGRTGVSTGVGPVGFYSSLGGGRRARGGGRPATGVASSQRRLAQSQKLEEARRLHEDLSEILALHRAEFAPAGRPIAPQPAPPDREQIYREHEAREMAGLRFFQRSARAGARKRATAATGAQVAAEWQRRVAAQRDYQQQLDHWWARLRANDADVVLTTLEEAFEDNEAPAAAVGIEGGEVSLVVLAPAMDLVPDRVPTITSAGNLSLRKLSKTDHVALYKQLVCGHLLLTVREAFAVAPGLSGAWIAVLRDAGRDPYGRAHVACLLAAHIARKALHGIHWASADAVEIVEAVATPLLTNERGRTRELQPLDLDGEPELSGILAAVDLARLESTEPGNGA